MPDAQAERVVRSRPEVLSATVDDELVLLDTDRGIYFGLGSAGRHIWELLAEPRTVDEICQVVREEFEVDPDQCRADVLVFLGELAGACLIEELAK